ncbi:mono/diheme cytochrome c family protein [Spirosoma oryzae]|uniref:Mono/diheme cytochrome c family protein n=1 Tax=Spirosoma oryzae TaxID=1469603 RepID=A0A2T0TI87_9BACT|nr:cytochrome c [Spirosoma oryzae]PRY45426.1 mono/diheme cytochrome c family protein [Spirosoma oryzae]
MIRISYNTGIVALTFVGLIVAGSGCKRGHDNTGVEYAPQMYDAVGYEPYRQVKPNEINPMKLNMRLPASGTVARPNYQTKFGSGDSTSADLMLYNIPADSIGISERVLKNPIPQSEQALADGKVLYGRYCQHCHGEGGKGDGPVAAQYKGVPNYSSDALKTLNDGHIFHVITNGKGRMWPHGSQITPDDRWKIVQYVHKLQQG